MAESGIPTEDERSILVPIVDLKSHTDTYGPGVIAFQPLPSMEKKADGSDARSSASPTIPAVSDATPERSLTIFALGLAVLEKAATGVGALGFIWATVVLLGGFAITLHPTDFWSITLILLVEGARIFSRSRELEWQHQVIWPVTHARMGGSRLLRAFRQLFRRRQGSSAVGTWAPVETAHRASHVPLFLDDHWGFLSRNISRLLCLLQLASAMACAALSSMRLGKHNYGETEKGDEDDRNRRSALNIFYSLALVEALLFLVEKGYWHWRVVHGKMLEGVSEECEMGRTGMAGVNRFFYDAYSRSINGSIFDGLRMDMATFAMDLLGSSSSGEQLMGIRILRQLSASRRFCNDTLQKIGTCSSATERLVEMLNWKNPRDEETRRSAADILSGLAGKKQNSLRVAGIPGALESISSLLPVSSPLPGDPDCSHLGLDILKKLARDHLNCWKIGNTRGLLPKIIDFTRLDDRALRDAQAKPGILMARRSLQIVKMLASTTGPTGQFLRREISEIVFTVSNIRDILQHGEAHPMLQQLGIEILSSLAVEDDTRERIGATGGVLREALRIFFGRESLDHLRTAAGEALAMLTLESQSNSRRIMRLKTTETLLLALEVPLLRVDAARILRNLCIYTATDCSQEWKAITMAAPLIINAIMSEESKLQEVMIGLAAGSFKFMAKEESATMFKRAGMNERALAQVLIRILRRHPQPSMQTPRIRRFTIELAIWMMEENQTNIQVFKNLGMEHEMEAVAENVSEVESFSIFSGSVGRSRYTETMQSLVEIALNLMADE